MFMYGEPPEGELGHKWIFNDEHIPGRIFVTHRHSPACMGELVSDNQIPEDDNKWKLRASRHVTLYRILWTDDPTFCYIEDVEDDLRIAYRKYMESKGIVYDKSIEDEFNEEDY